jgi:meiotically up-regulated gene 157 (Mug157) protein
MQNDNGQLSNPPYLFQRVTTTASDTLMMSGRGPPNNNAMGLTRSLFRPSDDAVTFPLNIPGNAMICVEITHLTTLLTQLQKLNSGNNNNNNQEELIVSLLESTDRVGGRICEALKGMIGGETVLPYEVDGYGGANYMDDANVPSLLSLPVLGFLSSTNPSYQKTRNQVLSGQNPFYYSGSAANGIGGPHVGTNMTWPMSIIMRAMTSTDEKEIGDCLSMLVSNTAGTGLMHESFNVNVNNGADFTRSWFAWANGLFGELILQLIETHPQLVLQNDSEKIALAQSLVKTPVSIQAQKDVLFK